MNIQVSQLNFPPPVNRLSNGTVPTGFFVVMIVGVLLNLVTALG
jgi:hypothetical protein